MFHRQSAVLLIGICFLDAPRFIASPAVSSRGSNNALASNSGADFKYPSARAHAAPSGSVRVRHVRGPRAANTTTPDRTYFRAVLGSN